MNNAPRHSYEFGSFHLDPAEHLLMRGEEPVQLPPKAFETLVLLVESSGHVLQKKELMAALWPNSFVEESNLTQNIFLLRKALGEDQGDHHYIKTVPRVGYRFVAPVRRVLDESDTIVVESRVRERIVVKEEIVEHEEETGQGDTETGRRGERRNGIRRSAIFTASSRVRIAGLIVGAFGIADRIGRRVL